MKVFKKKFFCTLLSKNLSILLHKKEILMSKFVCKIRYNLGIKFRIAEFSDFLQTSYTYVF